jgi:hypothetical protein
MELREGESILVPLSDILKMPRGMGPTEGAGASEMV